MTYSRSGVISAKPKGAGVGNPASRIRRSMWSSYSARRRTVENGFSSSSRPYTIVRVNLYQRSDRRWFSAYSFANNVVVSMPEPHVTRSGVEPADPSSPNGSNAVTVRSSCWSSAVRIASPRRPPTSRCARVPRRYVTGNASSGVNQSERDHRHRPAQHDGGDDVRRMVDGEVEADAHEQARSAMPATTLVRSRQLPAGTTVKTTPASTSAKASTGRDGYE